MLGYTPPQPQFWKALLAVAPFVALVVWSIQFFHVNIPRPVIFALGIGAWFAIAAAVNARVANDWRAEYTLNREAIERETSVTPNVRVENE